MVLPSFPANQVEGKSRNWLELPRDITTNILQRLDTIEIVTSASHVCLLWWNICKDPLMWRTIHMIKLRKSPFDLKKICRYAIERSCGQLNDIDIECFGTDDLLKFIAESGSNLRRMRLVDCCGISDKGMIEAAKHLPLLEELDISFSSLSKDSLEAIGRSCPRLKSLKYSRLFYEDYKCDDEALAIGKTLHELCNLKINGNILTNDGLLAILDGCPFLESLDLRDCLHLDLSGSLGKRCDEQIKNLRLPFNYVDCCFYDDDSYLDGLSEISNDQSDLDYEDNYDLELMMLNVEL